MKARKTTTHDVGNPVPGFGHIQRCGGVKRLKESKPHHYNGISHDNIHVYINKQ
jgi:hypothetical protein